MTTGPCSPNSKALGLGMCTGRGTNNTHNTFTGQFTEEKNLIETKYFKNNSEYIVQGKN